MRLFSGVWQKLGSVSRSPGATRAILVLLGIGVVLACGFHLAFLTRYPKVFIDEPWYANVAWNWLATGGNFDPMHSPTRAPSTWSYAASAPWAVSFALLGLGFFQARLVSWAFGVLLLTATVWVGSRTYGIVVGVLAALFLVLSGPFLQASHYARPDVVLAALVMTAVGAVLTGLEKERWWYHAAAGALMGIGAQVHLNGAILALGLIAIYPLAYGRRVLRWQGVWWFVGAGVVTYAALELPELWAEGGNALSGLGIALGLTHRPPVFDLSLMTLLRSLVHEIGRYHFYDNNLEFALIGAGLLYLLIRRGRADRLLLIFGGTAFLGFVLFVANKHDIYAILFYPFMLLMVAEVLVSLLRAGEGLAPQRIFAGALLILFLLNSAVHLVRPVLASRNYDYYAITDEIKSVVPAGARIMGLPHWWLGLAEYDYRSSLGLTFYHYNNGYSLTQGLEAIRPDVIIMEGEQQALLVDKGYFPPGPGFEIYRLPRREFEDFLSQRGQKLLEFSNVWHGDFEVYKIRWD